MHDFNSIQKLIKYEYMHFNLNSFSLAETLNMYILQSPNAHNGLPERYARMRRINVHPHLATVCQNANTYQTFYLNIWKQKCPFAFQFCPWFMNTTKLREHLLDQTRTHI